MSANEQAAKSLVRTSPVDGRVLGELEVFSEAQVQEAVFQARAAQKKWAALPVRQRCEKLSRFRDKIVDHAEDLIETMVLEGGKPRTEALHEILMGVDLLDYYLRRAHRWLKPQRLSLHLLKQYQSTIHYKPLGVVGILAPWNYPFCIPIGGVVTALIAGNAVVLKPSEWTSLVAVKTKMLFDQSGLEPTLFHVVTGEGPTGAALLQAGIDKLVLTGSVPTGKRVAAACGERLIPCVLELGGKAAAIVCKDANVEHAAQTITFGALINSGQVCIHVERVYVHQRLQHQLIEALERNIRKLRQGDPLKVDTDLGTMTFRPQLAIVDKLVADALQKGAQRVEVQPQRLGLSSDMMRTPVILKDCNSSMLAMNEEGFGPVIPIMAFQTEDEVLRLTNHSQVGLFHYVFSRDLKRAEQIARALECGAVMINDVLLAYGINDAPFGGVKHSGLGRVHGKEGLMEMVQSQHVCKPRSQLLRRNLFSFPYTERGYRWLTKLLWVRYRSGSWMQKLRWLFGKTPTRTVT